MASKLQIRSFKTKLSILVFAAILLPLVGSNILVGSLLNSQLRQSHEDRLKADLETFGLILQHTEEEFNQGLLRIASDNTLQVTLDLEIFSQLNHYLEQQIEVLGFSGLSVADKDKKIVASVKHGAVSNTGHKNSANHTGWKQSIFSSDGCHLS